MLHNAVFPYVLPDLGMQCSTYFQSFASSHWSTLYVRRFLKIGLDAIRRGNFPALISWLPRYIGENAATHTSFNLESMVVMKRLSSDCFVFHSLWPVQERKARDEVPICDVSKAANACFIESPFMALRGVLFATSIILQVLPGNRPYR